MAITNPYVSSNDITVFPAGFRGQSYVTGKALSEEALISLRQSSNISVNKNFFINDPDEPLTYYRIGIGGYVFKVKKSSVPNTSPLYAYIILRKINDNIGYVLDNIGRGSSTEGDAQYILDQEVSGKYLFQGLCFTDEIPTGVENYITIRLEGKDQLSAFRLSSSEIRDQYTAEDRNGSNIVVHSSKSIDQEFHTDLAEVKELIAHKFNPDSMSIGKLKITDSVEIAPTSSTSGAVSGLTTVNGRLFEEIFEEASTTVKLATAAKRLSIANTPTGVLYQNQSLTQVLSGEAGNGKKFVAIKDNSIPELSAIETTDIKDGLLTIAKTTGLQSALDSKVVASNGEATNLTVKTKLNISDNSKLVCGNGVVVSSTSAISNPEVGQVVFVIQN